MEELLLSSYAKVNLVLDILGKRAEDGYHNVRTIMVPVSLADRIKLRRAPEITVVSLPPIPGPAEANLAYRAALLLREATGYRGGAEIQMEKQIPVAGGLAGGSSNGAAVLAGLNRLWGTGLSEAELTSLAIRLGSDVPFFIGCRPALVEGIGERVTPIPVRRPLWLVLATPNVAKSTGTVYQWFDQLPHATHPDTAAAERALAQGDAQGVADALGNVFEPVMLPRHPAIGELKRAMLDQGALGALMSGAGPTVFGLAADQAAAARLAAGLALQGIRAWPVHTVEDSRAASIG